MPAANLNSILDLKVTIDHPRHQKVLSKVEELLRTHVPGEPFILPIVGPTRVGKSLLLNDLQASVAHSVRGPGSLLEGLDFRIGQVPPKPNDRDIYCAIIKACGYPTSARERTTELRGRTLRILRDLALRTIALDEVNHLIEKGANIANRAAGDHLKVLADQCGAALLIVGLPRLQKMIDQNEQFRDRCHATIVYLPYDWNVPEDRDAFAGTVFAVFGLFAEAGIRLELDQDDCVHRLYAASGGRVGMMVWLMDGASRKLQGALNLDAIRRAALDLMQDKQAARLCFGPAPVDEAVLVRSFIKVLQEAELTYSARTTLDLEAMVG